MVTFDSLEIRGREGLAVANTFLRQLGPTLQLAMVFPGIRYSVQGPLLYYGTKLFLERQADVLLIEQAYSRIHAFLDLAEREQLGWIYDDAAAASATVLKQRAYGEVTLIGKSLGTHAVAHLAQMEGRPFAQQLIWFTPVLVDDRVQAAITAGGARSLVIIGSRDHYYDERFLAAARSAGVRVVCIDGADHGMEVDQGAAKDIGVLQTVIQQLADFIAR